jgi:spore maturation protein CgeB
MREALSRCEGVDIDDVGEDLYVPVHRSVHLRAINRALRPFQRKELESDVRSRLASLEPDALIVYKGTYVSNDFIEKVKLRGVLTVNVFPDYSPLAYGDALRMAMGSYDLVISTKPFHPDAWCNTYGYNNRCVCVPHGYDPAVHLWPEPPSEQPYDVVLAATWREEYDQLLRDFARATSNSRLRIAVAGAGWTRRANGFPEGWQFGDQVWGRSYTKFLRQGKIAIAPVHSRVVIAGRRYQGDEDTTRTYELAAAHCFFVHKRTPFARTVYDETSEVPMWNDSEELASLVMRYLPQESERRAFAAAAHARAVPSYSIPTRARKVLEHVRLARIEKLTS